MREALDQLFASNQISRKPQDLAHWGKDWTTGFRVAPSAVVFPHQLSEIVELVRLANRDGLQLVPSGGRTGLSGGAVASQGEVVVSFDRMHQILDFNPADRLVRCQAGVVTATLQNFAVDHDLYYPVDFASSGSSQLGGNIATNAGGIKVIRYGLTRDWIAGLQVVTGTGAVLECNRGLVKNATGYDLRHLFIGSEGTLGFVVEADVRLTAAPEPQRVMLLGVPKFRDILAVLGQLQKAVSLTAFEFFSELALDKVRAARNVGRPLTDPCSFYVLLEFDESSLASASHAFEHCLAQGWVVDGVLSQSDAQAASLWTLREDISESLSPFAPYKNDISVRVQDMPGFLDDVNKLVDAEYPEFEICWYGHIGDGNLHLNILKPDNLDGEAFYELCHAISPKLYELVAINHGSISAEHGVGLLKRDFLKYSRSASEIELMRALKGVFDPNQIMNPGKLLI